MNKVRGTLALALALVGIGAMSSVSGVPSQEKAPATPKTPGQTPPEKNRAGGWAGPRNHNPEGPACPGGPMYRKVWSEEAKVWAWRAQTLSLYYRDRDGGIHAYQPGEEATRDKAFPRMAKDLGLVIIPRAERRAMHREERARYRAILKARKAQEVTS